jgi:hypothetical protein
MPELAEDGLLRDEHERTPSVAWGTTMKEQFPAAGRIKETPG